MTNSLNFSIPLITDDEVQNIRIMFEEHRAANKELYFVIRSTSRTSNAKGELGITQENNDSCCKLELVLQGPSHFIGIKPGLYYIELHALDLNGYRYTLKSGDEIDEYQKWEMEHDDEGNLIEEVPFIEKNMCYDVVSSEIFSIKEIKGAILAYEERRMSENWFREVTTPRVLTSLFPDMVAD